MTRGSHTQYNKGYYPIGVLQSMHKSPLLSSRLLHTSIRNTCNSKNEENSKQQHYPTYPLDDFSHMKYWELSSVDDLCNNNLQPTQEVISEDVVKAPEIFIDHSAKFWNEFTKTDVSTDKKESKENGDESNYLQPEISEGGRELEEKLSHVDKKGEAQMVDVSSKNVSVRQAIARAEVYLGPIAFNLVKENKMKKGDVLGVARIAGIMAAKKTSDLIPLCHPLPLDHVEILFDMQEKFEEEMCYRTVIDAKATTSGRTGVEMEALTAATVAALTIYDMCKAVSHDITISNVQLMFKTGGKREFVRKS